MLNAYATKTPDLVALAVARAAAKTGRKVDMHPGMVGALTGITAKPRKEKAPDWTEAEDAFLEKNLGYMTEAEIGKHLGRTETAVRLRWKRDLHLTAPSKHPDVITAHQAADMLGIDAHKLSHWVDRGLIPGRIMAGGRKIRLIKRVSLFVWACSPKNWVYFDIHQVRDEKLKRLLALRAERWGDEWWDGRQAADYHGLTPKDILRYVKLGRVQSFHLPVSLGGRHDDLGWAKHYYLKSDVIKLRFVFGKGNTELRKSKFTPTADAWLLKARDELGMTFVHIGRTMKIGNEKINPYGGGRSNPTISHRYKFLKAEQAKAAKKRKARK